mgnify:CR=1 FL=1
MSTSNNKCYIAGKITGINYKYAKSLFYSRLYEVLFMISLDSQNRVISTDIVCEGVTNSVNISLRNILSIALRTNAVSIILAHNHPGGKAFPSEADRQTTDIIKNAPLSINVRLIDHIIVAGDEYISMNFDLHILDG